ncbi:MAG: DNA polymerase clamp loader subunit A [Proteobacteria bacterium]|nr:DNA polymerase clamp loader subunit A [Pseudomonadota bacterium]
MMRLSDFLTAINYSKESMLDTDDEMAQKDYVPFVINRCLSYFPDTILHANEMNKCSHIEKRLQFDYLRFAIRKRKRYSKWLKDETSENLDLIKRNFNYSNSKAKEALSILTSEDIENIKNMDLNE